MIELSPSTQKALERIATAPATSDQGRHPPIRNTPTADPISLQEHNERHRPSPPWAKADPVFNGIACPKCGHELIDSDPDRALLTYPIQYRIHCPSCGYSGTRF